MIAGITKENVREGVIITLKITLIFGVFFTIVNQNFDVKSIVFSFVVSGIYSFGLGFGQGLLNDYLSNKWSWIEHTKKRVWSGVIATIGYTVPVVLLINYLQFVIIPGVSADAFLHGKYLWTHLFFIILSFGISAFLHARSFMIAWKKSVKQESTQQEIVAKTETAKFESLKSQIDPHFLFNSLNVLTSLISENPSQAEKFTTKLSKVYRYVLEQRNKDLIPLTEELTFAKTYMELLGMRFEDAVQFNIPASVTNQELKIVPLSLQLLLENAVKHNVVSSSKPLIISIYEENDYLVIENNVNPKEAVGKSTKVGLQNIADRYGLITHKSVQVENNNKTFKVRIPLLIKMNDIMYQENIENSKYARAIEKVERLKEFYQSLVSYCIVIPLLIYINFEFSPDFKWFWFPLIFWGISLIFKYLEVQNFNIFLGKNWEERKIKELMNQENKK